ncbi:unnamed protein product [Paramecium sonneborni]|uniref:Uncharacterized protein n=1 Tax=Paramecium sonneborni TaxID=65129 RepID=A0A8S1QPW5_9CILI|nr:unnamed protein product [Paramecium sonneborni]
MGMKNKKVYIIIFYKRILHIVRFEIKANIQSTLERKEEQSTKQRLQKDRLLHNKTNDNKEKKDE